MLRAVADGAGGLAVRKRSRVSHATGRQVPGSRLVSVPSVAVVTMVAALAIVMAVPLVFDPAGYRVFLPLKWWLCVTLVPLGLCVRRGRLPLARTWTILLGLIAVSCVTALSRVTAVVGTSGRNLGLVAWLVFAGAFWLGAELRPMARLVVRCGVFGSLPVSAYAVAQAAGIHPIRLSRGLDLARARSPLGNASFLGAYLVLVVPLALALVVDRDETGHIRWAAGVPLVLGLAALLATQSRAAWLGATASLAIVCWMNRGRLRSTTSRLVVLAGVVVVVLAVGVSGLGGRA